MILNKCNYLILIIFFSTVTTSMSQSKILLDLKNDERTARKLFFYPSTLRMLNLGGNEDYYDFIKDVRKVTLFKMKEGDFKDTDLKQLHHQLTEKEQYEELINIDGIDQKLSLLNKASPEQSVVLVLWEGAHYVGEVQGSIDIMKLPELYEAITSQDSTMSGGFINLFDLNGIRSHQRDTIIETDDSGEHVDTLPSRS